MLLKVLTFKRTVTYSVPDQKEVDKMVAGKFVAEYEPIPEDLVEELKKQPGGLTDAVVLRHCLKTVSGDADTPEEVMGHRTARGAAVRTYYEAMAEGIAGKNSAT